jgi:TolB-like protein/DNA-binding winged helix-turn-helix (wHTH) protein/Flp pilus assembly protein TadD
VFEFGRFRVDAAQRVLLADGERVPLNSRGFDLLLHFVRHPGELLDKDRLMKAVWPNTVVEENNLNQSIGAIRKALGESPGEHRFIVTEPGRGYRFVAPVTRAPMETGTQAPPAEAPPGPGHGRWVLIGIVVLAIVGGIVLTMRDRAPPVTDRSIAVLPFENRSEARENAYLALGIQDEILTLLTRVDALRVVPRASTARYADGGAAAPDVGRELGVAYLLSGSVQREGDRVRVHVALVDASRDRQVWASSYERLAREVFAIESEVARDVAASLQARLTAGELTAISTPPTPVPAAYDAYLRAKSFAERVTRTEAEIHGAIDAYEEAVRLDPDFAAAWAQLSRRNANLFSLSYDRSAGRRDAALRALERAEAIAPDRPDVLAARAYFLLVVEGDLDGAERDSLELERRSPTNPDGPAALGQIMRQRGDQARSDAYSKRVLELDPRNPYRQAIICQGFLIARRFDDADRTCARALELLPGDTGILAIRATIYQVQGRLDQSRALLRGLVPAPGDWRSLRAMSQQGLLDRQPESAVALLSSFLANPDELGSRVGVVRRWLADAQRLAGNSDVAKSTYIRALTEVEQELARQPANPLLVAELAILRARLGSLEAGVRLEPRCLELASHPRVDQLLAECKLARVQVELAAGDPARAVAGLKELLTLNATPPVTPEWLKLDPEYDALRSRKDFQSLL